MWSLLQKRKFRPDRLGADWVSSVNTRPPGTAKVVHEVEQGFHATPAELLLALGDASTSGAWAGGGTLSPRLHKLWAFLRYADLIAAPHGRAPSVLALSATAAAIRRRGRAALSEEFGIALAIHMARAHLLLTGELADADTADPDPVRADSPRFPDYLFLDAHGRATAVVECKGKSGAPHGVVRAGLAQLAQVVLAHPETPNCRRLVLGAELDSRPRQGLRQGECPVNALAVELVPPQPTSDRFGRQHPDSWPDHGEPPLVEVGSTWSPGATALRLLAWCGAAEDELQVGGLPVVGQSRRVQDEQGTFSLFVGLYEPFYRNLREDERLFREGLTLTGSDSLDDPSFRSLSASRRLARQAVLESGQRGDSPEGREAASGNVVVEEQGLTAVLAATGLAVEIRTVGEW